LQQKEEPDSVKLYFTRVVQWFVHPQYDDTLYLNDIAIALLANPVTNSTKAKVRTATVVEIYKTIFN
jgi:hypothetical protein